MTEPQTSGIDMARAAFRAARAAAKNQPVKKPRPRRTIRRDTDGRDPISLGGAITGLITDHGWETPANGGNILDQWPTLCPDYATTVQPVHYDPEHGRLDLRPASHAYAAQLRLSGPQLAQRINSKLGATAVRSIRVLAPGPVTPTSPAPGRQTPTQHTAEPPRVRTRDDASPGYHQARAAISRKDPVGMKPRLEREHGIGEYARLREPRERFTDAVVALENEAKANRARARAERAGRIPDLPTAFQRTA
ncbi:DciA family protein [Streptomyces sp. DSM 41534]